MTQKITKVRVKNYKGIRGEIELSPTGSLLVLAGPNGAGKSSFLDAMAEVFDPKGVRLTSKPIHDGEKSAEIEVTTTVARILRKFTKNDAGTMTAYALDGAKYPSAKEFIIDATGGAIFDARVFVNLDEKDQRDQLLKQVELPFDLAALDAERKAAFDGRTDANREVKRLTAARDAKPTPAADTPIEEISSAQAYAALDEARRTNERVFRARSTRQKAEQDVAELEQRLAEARAALDTIIAEASSLPAVVDTTALQARLESLDATNTAVRAANEWRKLDAELQDFTKRAEELTARIEALDAQKAEGLAAAKFPLEPLSVDETGITYGGIPFKQVNTAEQTLIAFSLLTTPQPDLRLIFIKDGDSLDSNTLDRIVDIADARGYLVVIERDRDRDETSVTSAVFREGQLA